MARARSNGNGKLEDALATVLQTQAVMQQSHADMIVRFSQFEKEMSQMRRESDERFARIEAILLEHNRILSRLADTVGEKIGFKISPSQGKAE
jgi:hypothetical protein